MKLFTNEKTFGKRIFGSFFLPLIQLFSCLDRITFLKLSIHGVV